MTVGSEGRREDELNDGKKYIFYYNLSCFAASEKFSSSFFTIFTILFNGGFGIFFLCYSSLFIPASFTIGAVVDLFRFEFFAFNKFYYKNYFRALKTTCAVHFIPQPFLYGIKYLESHFNS